MPISILHQKISGLDRGICIRGSAYLSELFPCIDKSPEDDIVLRQLSKMIPNPHLPHSILSDFAVYYDCASVNSRKNRILVICSNISLEKIKTLLENVQKEFQVFQHVFGKCEKTKFFKKIVERNIWFFSAVHTCIIVVCPFDWIVFVLICLITRIMIWGYNSIWRIRQIKRRRQMGWCQRVNRERVRPAWGTCGMPVPLHRLFCSFTPHRASQPSYIRFHCIVYIALEEHSAKEGRDCFLRHFLKLTPYRDDIEIWNREEIPFPSRRVLMGLSCRSTIDSPLQRRIFI